MRLLKITWMVPAVILLHFTASAQHDSSYYVAYPRHLTTRFYFSQKYTALSLNNKTDNFILSYVPNTTLNMGVGATYKWFTLNLGYGFGFLNPSENRGKTKYLDLQFHGYGQKFNIDVLGQFYRGFYLYPQGPAVNSYYNRPDIRVNALGATFQYITNHKRFSFRSSVLQNEWQKKSAGTALVGFEIYTGTIKSDSTLIPTFINQEAASLNEKHINFFEIGPNVGYAYTLVVKEHFFLTGAASGSLDYGFSTATDSHGENRRYGFSPNYLLRISTGYNSAKWAISLVYVNNGLNLTGPNSSRVLLLNTGNLRLNYVHRFVPSRKEKKVLEEVIK